MKSLLIAEEDRNVRQEICAMIRHSGIPVDIIFECSDGEAALTVAEEKAVDVVFTAVNMPRMDGIQLTKKLKQMDPPPLVVAISGDNDFSSAVRMMQNGVRDYILKPADPWTVRRILQELNEEIEKRERRQYTELRICEMWIRNLMLYEIPPREEIELLEEKYEGYFFPEEYIVCACERQSLKSSSGRRIVLNDVDEGQICLVARQHLKPFLRKELPDKAVGISQPHHGIAELKTAYMEVREARERAFCTGKKVQYGEESPTVPKRLREQAGLLLEEKARVRRIQLIGTDKREELEKQWRNFFEAVMTERISPELFQKEMKELLLEIKKIYRNIFTEEDVRTLDSYGEIWSFDSLEQYGERVLSWLKTMQERIVHQQEEGQNQQKIRQALEYIEQNYSNDLNMAVVSNYISMNYSLFSLLFKQYTGCKFVNYLRDIRIREAKRLLGDTDMKIAEISQSVGYDNEKNFMKVFKAACGVSPTEYRKNMKTV